MCTEEDDDDEEVTQKPLSEFFIAKADVVDLPYIEISDTCRVYYEEHDTDGNGFEAICICWQRSHAEAMEQLERRFCPQVDY